MATDIAEDFNLSGRGKSRSFSLRSVGPRPVRLKVECTKPLLDLAGQLLYVYSTESLPFVPPQQNLWGDSGSGRRPKL